MSSDGNKQTAQPAFRLETKRTIAATPERLFEAWTRPAHLQNWWGPQGVDCPFAEVDLREGGSYRIANRFADGAVIWISGEFEIVEPPRRLVYSWTTDASMASTERVTVRFSPCDAGTEITVTHELVRDQETLNSHESGWQGCLDRLAGYLSDAA